MCQTPFTKGGADDTRFSGQTQGDAKPNRKNHTLKIMCKL